MLLVYKNTKDMKGIKRYKFPVIKEISHGNVMHSMAIIANNTVMYIWKLLREQSSHKKKDSVIIYGDGC